MTTIFEALQNAKHNLQGSYYLQVEIGKEQLHNAVTLLEKGYGVNDEIDPLLAKYGTVEDVPEKGK